LNKKLYNWQTPDFKLEQFLRAFTSRGFHSVSWAFLFLTAPSMMQWIILTLL